MRFFQFVTGSEAPKLPQRQTERSACYDFYLPCAVTIPPNGGRVKIKSGIKALMGADEVLHLYIRSSYAIKKKLSISNGVGIIDSDYYNNPDNEGEIMCELVNNSDVTVWLAKGDRYMQGEFTKFLTTDDDVARGKRSGGIGSTDKEAVKDE